MFRPDGVRFASAEVIVEPVLERVGTAFEPVDEFAWHGEPVLVTVGKKAPDEQRDQLIVLGILAANFPGFKVEIGQLFAAQQHDLLSQVLGPAEREVAVVADADVLSLFVVNTGAQHERSVGVRHVFAKEFDDHIFLRLVAGGQSFVVEVIADIIVAVVCAHVHHDSLFLCVEADATDADADIGTFEAEPFGVAPFFREVERLPETVLSGQDAFEFIRARCRGVALEAASNSSW